MPYIVHTERLLENGVTDRFDYKCNTWSKSGDVIEFFNKEGTKHYFIPITKMDLIVIINDDGKPIEQKEVEVKCTT